MDDVIVLKLYTNTLNKSSYLSSKPLDSPEFDIVQDVHVINPVVRPIPVGMTLLCAKNVPSLSDGNSIEIVYDPFNVSTTCTRFLAWLSPVPYTAPLYILNNGVNTYMTFDSQDRPEGYVDSRPSKIYVLKPADKYRFRSYQGRCVPEPNGKLLSECVIDNVLSKMYRSDRIWMLQYGLISLVILGAILML